MSTVIQAPEIDIPFQTSSTDERAVRWGILAGGPQRMPLEGIGRMYVGHGYLSRRELIPFMPLVVGGRNEDPSMLEQDYRLPAYQATYDPEPGAPGRFSTLPNVRERKWPLEAVRGVEATFKVMGFGVLDSLTGLDAPEDLYKIEDGVVVPLFHKSEASKVFNALLPKLHEREKDGSLKVGTLIDFIDYLKSVRGRAEQNGFTRLHDELTTAAQRCRMFYADFIRKRLHEISESSKPNVGGRGTLDEGEIEIFRELHEPLPEEKSAIANAHLGREIAEGLVATSGNNDGLAAAILKMAENQTKMLEHLVTNKRGKVTAENKGEQENA